MTLTQQLEDKKKELEDIKNLQNLNDGEWMWNERARQIIILKKEIAILEQAIAEMQKQRQEILKKLELLFADCDLSREEIYLHLKQQINQPKTEGCGRMFNDFIFGERICGQFEDLKHSDHIILCPDCKKENSKK